MKRVRIKDYKEFFKDIKKNKSLKEFSKKSNISYSCLKRWSRGENLIPEKIFLRLLGHSKKRAKWKNQASYKEENWGQKIAGKIIKGLPKKELKKRMKVAREGIKDKPNKVRLKFNKKTCEFYGALMGDGCITKHKVKNKDYYKYIISFTGHKELDRDYHEKYLKDLIKEEFNINPYIQTEKNRKVRTLKLFNQSLLNELIKVGFPLGKKGQKLRIPKRLQELPWSLQKQVIRGLFDTDGSIYARKDEFYRHPHLSITSISKPLIRQLHNILRKRGYPAWINKSPSKSAQMVIVKGNKNAIRWIKDIGSSNPKHIFKYQYWLKNKNLPAYLLGP